MKLFLRTYGITTIISLLAWGLVGINIGLAALITTVILSVLEISLSFDNAVVNAKVLKRMSRAWQRIFLTVGMLIAVLGVRLILPVLLVSVFAHMGLKEVWDLVINNPEEYGRVLHHIHPEVAAFGGIFLLMLFLDYIMGRRQVLWLAPLEKRMIVPQTPLKKTLEVAISIIALALAVFIADPEHQKTMVLSGLAGLLIYAALSAFNHYFEKQDLAKTAAHAGLAAFIYLEVLDASFSLDGVLGAFAITSDIIVITVGLGIGALWVRSMTIHLVETDTLANYRYLEHGAHYAIGVLAVLLLASASYDISEVVTGLVGLVIIVAALIDSIHHNRKQRR